jgi:hypothetical protein
MITIRLRRSLPVRPRFLQREVDSRAPRTTSDDVVALRGLKIRQRINGLLQFIQ